MRREGCRALMTVVKIRGEPPSVNPLAGGFPEIPPDPKGRPGRAGRTGRAAGRPSMLEGKVLAAGRARCDRWVRPPRPLPGDVTMAVRIGFDNYTIAHRELSAE